MKCTLWNIIEIWTENMEECTREFLYSKNKCGNCLNDTICCSTVVTRASRIPGRIKVILVGEDLGL